ncbi:response regulator [Mycolicibacterium sp. HS_4_1]
MTTGEASPAPVRVAIIDDHDVVHAGVEAWCSHADPPIHFVGSYLDPDSFLQRHPMPDIDVDVVVFDLQIDGNRPEFDALKGLCAAGYRVVVFSHLSADEVILQCLDLGAVTYLVKSEGRAHLVEAIHSASSVTPHVGPQMARALVNDNDANRPNLSVREKEVLVAWFQTESKDLVGKRLYIAPSTVRTHLQRARAKYAGVGRSAPTKSALLARAIEDGILGLPDL